MKIAGVAMVIVTLKLLCLHKFWKYPKRIDLVLVGETVPQKFARKDEQSFLALQQPLNVNNTPVDLSLSAMISERNEGSDVMYVCLTSSATFLVHLWRLIQMFRCPMPSRHGIIATERDILEIQRRHIPWAS